MRRVGVAVSVFGVLVLALVALGQAVGTAQEATPGASPATGVPNVMVTLTDVDGNEVGTATLTESVPGQVDVSVQVTAGIEPGDHGVHVHEAGLCEADAPAGPFTTAGAHYNPTGQPHGGPDSPEAHAGDLGNITVADDGTGELTVTTDRITLSAGPTTLMDADGSALLIHAQADDLETQPSGDSGGRIACGVVYQPMAGMGTPIPGTPMASPVASPAA